MIRNISKEECISKHAIIINPIFFSFLLVMIKMSELVVVSINIVNHQPLENKDIITEIRSC